MLDLRDDGAGGVLLAVKAVPGARSDQIAGLLGDRLKVRVAAPPEDGKANRAICDLIADVVGVRPRDVGVVSGHAGAEKTLRISGMSAAALRAKLGL